MKEEFVAHYVMYAHDFFLEDSVESVYPFVDKILIARTTKPWFGPPIPLDETEQVLAKIEEKYGDKIEIFTGAFPNEQTQRNFLIQKSRERGHGGAFIVDCDEVFIENAFPKMFQFLLNNKVNGLRVPYLTFIKDASFCVAPPYESALFFINLEANHQFTWGRLGNLESVTLKNNDPGILHFSYIREKDSDVLNKIRSFMHAQERVNWDEWYQKVYRRFHPRLKNFHPTHPQAWSGLQEFDPGRFPSALRRKLAEKGKLFHYQFIRGKSSLRLHLGCGGQKIDGYINIDLYHPQADLIIDITDLAYFEDNSVDEIFMNAVFEHLYTFEQPKALADWYRVLKPNGLLIIHSIPDFDEVIRSYIQRAPGHHSSTFDIDEVFGYTHGRYVYENRFGQMHKDIFTKGKIEKLLREAGFDILRIENVCWRHEPNPVNINVIARKPANPRGAQTGMAYQLAQEHIRLGKSAEAIKTLEELLKSCPTHSAAHDDLGVLYYQKGDKSRALECFVKSVQSDGKNMNALKNLADLCMELGHREEAIQFYRKILAHEPGDLDALLGVAGYCVQTGQIREAKIFYKKVLQMDPGNDLARTTIEALEEPSPGTSEIPMAPNERESSKPAARTRKLTSIIILVHNQLIYTQKCLESLFLHTGTPFELIIVDNGSTDGTLGYLDELRQGKGTIAGWRLRVDQEGRVEGCREGASLVEAFPHWQKAPRELWCIYFKVLHNEKNLGFPGGNNQGMAHARGEYILLLNNDTVVTPGWLDRLIAGLERKEEIGIVGPMSNCVDGLQEIKEIRYDPNSLEGLDRFSQAFAEEYAGQGQPVWRCIGFCILIKRAVVEEIGGFDTRYGVGLFEDDDFCLRAAIAGFRAWVVKDCFVHHFGSKTFREARIDYYGNLAKNWEIFKQKWGLPQNLAPGDYYDLSFLLKEGFIPQKHYCPLSPLEDLSKKGEELFARGDLDGAQKIFEEVLLTNPNHPEALNNLGVVAYQKNNPDLAVHYLSRALKVDPSHTDAMVNLGNCLMKQKEFSQASQWLKKALDQNPYDVSLLNALGNCFIQLEDFAQAEKIYERSYHLDKNQRQVGEVLATLEKMKAFECYREGNF